MWPLRWSRADGASLDADGGTDASRRAGVLFQALNSHGVSVALAFGIIYACSLSFVYIEGDDASTIAFHAMGRNAALQPPYSPYHGMMDLALSSLPAREPILRVTAIAVSSVAAGGFVMLTLSLVFEWLGNVPGRRKGLIALLILLASPEFFYFGLVYTPSVVAMCFVLAAHLLVRRAAQGGQSSAPPWAKALVALSLLFYGLGTACRWDVGAYGLVIFTDLVSGAGAQGRRLAFEKRRVGFAVLWGSAAVLCALAAIIVSGYGVNGLFNSYDVAQNLVAKPTSWFSTVGSFQTLLTPAFSLLCVTGLLVLARKQEGLALLGVVGLIPVLPLILTEPKMIISAIPGLVLCAVAGFNAWCFGPPRKRLLMAARLLIGLLALAPWLVGVRVYSGDTAWGPGFELKTFGSAPTTDEKNIVGGEVDTRRVSIRRVALTTGGGMALPTLEGPRPLGGHMAVLLGGGWRTLVKGIDEERRRAIQEALTLRRPIVQDNRHSLILVHLARLGFTTADARNRLLPSGVVERRFANSRGEQLTLMCMNGRSALFDDGQLDGLAQAVSGDTVVFYSSYSSLIMKLSASAPAAVRPLGAFSANLKLNELRSVARTAPPN